MFYNDWTQIFYIAFMVVLFLGAIALIALIGRLVLAATAALQSYRRLQELKIETAIADRTDDIKL